MSNQKRIALFVDVDNLQLGKEHIDNLLYKLEKEGTVVYGKFYGGLDKKYKDVLTEAAARGFEIVTTMRNKKRGGKIFDARILVDVMELIYTNPSVDAVAVVSQPADLVHLFSKLRREDVEIMAMDNLDEDCMRFVNEVLNFGYITPFAKPAIPAKRPAATPGQKTDSAEDLEILKQIQTLKETSVNENGQEDSELLDKIKKLLEEFS